MELIKFIFIGTLLIVFTFSCKNTGDDLIIENPIKEYEIGINRDTIEVNNQDRNFKFYLPGNLSDDASLLFRFHGSYSVSDYPEKELPDPVNGINDNFILNKIADTANVVVVYPAGSFNGYSIGWIDTETELKFFDEMLEYFKLQISNINFNKVYVCGHSSGAIFSYALAGYKADKIAAAASVSGQYRLVKGANDSFVSDNISIPLRAYNGTIDKSVNYQSAYRNINIWAELENKGDSVNRVVSNLIIANYDITITDWQGGLSDLELYSIQGVGHYISWIKIGESIWNFMKSHSKNQTK